MAGIIFFKLKGSSLMEAIVAMVISSAIFIIALSIYIKVNDYSYKNSEINSILILDDVAIETKKSKTFFDEDIDKGAIIVKKQISKYNNKENLILLHLEAVTKEQKVLSSRNELIILSDAK
jgi:hypothetical protein